MTTSISELQNMTETESRYRRWERIEEMNILRPIDTAHQWENVLMAKWGMLVNQGGSL